MLRCRLIVLLAVATSLSPVWSSPLWAELKLPAVLSSHMVLQRGEAVPIWGWDSPGTVVSVRLGDLRSVATAGADGKWTAYLPAMKAGGPHTVTISGSSVATLEDVLVGEVWLCSGQSNMEWSIRQSKNADEEIAAATDTKIRHIKLRHTPAAEPQTVVPSDGWKVTSPETAPNFTAVGYYFGRKLRAELDVPIGLIGSNWGGTRIEPWTPPVGFQRVEALKNIADNLGEFPKKRGNGSVDHQSALALYNGMIHPLLPYAIRGALWYQGESNNGEGMLYFEKMKALVQGWREVWNDSELPFYFVQLAPFRYRGDPTRLPGIWEAQTASLALPHTGMAVTVDIGNVTDIHPRNKQDVGARLALWALAQTYGRINTVYSGPLYTSMEVDGNSVRLRFDHVGGGLISRDGEALTHFTVAGESKEFHPATAEIQGDTVVVRSEAVSAPVAVRFGWHQEAEPNLSNKEGLPASPFRTDDW